MNADSFIQDVYVPLIRALDEFVDRDRKDKIIEQYIAYVIHGDFNNLVQLLYKGLRGEFGHLLMDRIITQVNDDVFNQLLEEGRKMIDISKTGSEKFELDPIQNTYDKLVLFEKTRCLQNRSDKDNIENVKAGINNIIMGELKAFQDKEFMRALPLTLDQLLDKQKYKSVEVIIDKLCDGLLGDDLNTRLDISQTLSLVIGKMASKNYLGLFPKLPSKLCEWLLVETSFPPSYRKMCNILRDQAERLISELKLEEAHGIFNTFFLISSGKVKKDATVQTIASGILKDLATDEVLDFLLTEYETDVENKRNIANQCLVPLGLPVAKRLLTILRESQTRYERTRIIQTLTEMGRTALPAMIEQLQTEEPWYYIRNLVLLIGKVGDERHLPMLQPLLNYGDLRVQRETLNSIFGIGGKKRENIILSHLPIADGRLKIEIVRMLGDMKMDEAVPLLLELLKSSDSMPPSIKTELPEKICDALGKIGSPKAIPALIQIVGQKEGDFIGISENKKARAMAATALAMIRGKTEKLDEAIVIHDAESVSSLQSPHQILTQQEAFVNKYISTWNNDDTVEEYAVKLLFDLIVKYARDKDFARAETYWEKLIRIDPMATTEIRISREIINVEKQESVKHNHLQTWQKLYSTMTADETNALYYSLREMHFDADRAIFMQGDANQILYFVNEGELKAFYNRDDEEVWFKILEAGNIAGEENFFQCTVCTTSVVSLTETKVSFLDMDVFSKIKDEFPALESKLWGFCNQYEPVYEILKKNGMDRRLYDRHESSANLNIKFLDEKLNSQKIIVSGHLINISDGGLAFTVNKAGQSVRSLLNQDLQIDFRVILKKAEYDIHKTGKIVAITNGINGNHQIHFKFDETLPFVSGSLITEKTIPQKRKIKDDFLITKF